MSLASIIAFAAALYAGVLAAAVAWHERRSLVHWSFAAGMLALAVESAFVGLSARGGAIESVVHWQGLGLLALAFLPGCWLFFSLSYARGNYREFLARWQLVLLVAFLAPLSLALSLRDELILGADKATGTEQVLLHLGAAGTGLHLMLLLAAVLVLMNLERTYRAAVGTMRWRIKFMVLGLGVLFAARAYTSSQALLFHGGETSLQVVDCGALLLACLLVTRALLRSGQFEVSIYPSHSLLHHSFTVLLAGAYLLIVGVFAKVVALVGGAAAFPLTAFFVLVALVLLTMLLLSDRARLYTKRFVSRHFQRPLYDYRTVWRTFTEGTTRRVEQDELCRAVVRLVSEFFQSLSVSIWLVDERREHLLCAASSSLSASRAGQLALEPADAAEVIAALSAHPEPLDIDACRENWAVPLRLAHPEEFHKGGNRVCVPLLAGGELLGVLMLGDRVGGLLFSEQDLDLLKSVGDQAAACLLNIQLSQRLAQAKQLEAFQAMSAFFVHDLKNTGSTLSLMLQNLPVHYQDPQFREDALRGISKTVTHINDVISRLTVLRHELAIQAVDCDLNELVSDTLKTQAQPPGPELVQELRPLPRLRLDPAQIQRVLTNLVLNAREALGPGGRIRVETSQRNGWAVLSVSDTGCGISPEFIRHSLFRPFQTTKKRGIGIGMFHSKMIVEAHRGRIEVESQLGRGTSFHVLLPLAAT